MIITIFLLTQLMNPSSSWADVRVRNVEVKKDQIVTIRTAVGIATIIQVPDRPNSLVVGNPGGFKVEYLDQAITIKPSYPGARSNLYIYTDYRRYNVQLITTSEPNADYVVYLENPVEKAKSVSIPWVKFKNHLRNESLVLETDRLAKMRDGMLLVEFRVTSDLKERFKPDWIWLSQDGRVKAIHNLALSGDKLTTGSYLKGIIQVLREDIDPSKPFKIELRRKKTTFLTIPKVNAWK